MNTRLLASPTYLLFPSSEGGEYWRTLSFSDDGTHEIFAKEFRRATPARQQEMAQCLAEAHPNNSSRYACVDSNFTFGENVSPVRDLFYRVMCASAKPEYSSAWFSDNESLLKKLADNLRAISEPPSSGSRGAKPSHSKIWLEVQQMLFETPKGMLIYDSLKNALVKVGLNLDDVIEPKYFQYIGDVRVLNDSKLPSLAESSAQISRIYDGLGEVLAHQDSHDEFGFRLNSDLDGLLQGAFDVIYDMQKNLTESLSFAFNFGRQNEYPHHGSYSDVVTRSEYPATGMEMDRIPEMELALEQLPKYMAKVEAFVAHLRDVRVIPDRAPFLEEAAAEYAQFSRPVYRLLNAIHNLKKSAELFSRDSHRFAHWHDDAQRHLDHVMGEVDRSFAELEERIRSYGGMREGYSHDWEQVDQTKKEAQQCQERLTAIMEELERSLEGDSGAGERAASGRHAGKRAHLSELLAEFEGRSRDKVQYERSSRSSVSRQGASRFVEHRSTATSDTGESRALEVDIERLRDEIAREERELGQINDELQQLEFQFKELSRKQDNLLFSINMCDAHLKNLGGLAETMRRDLDGAVKLLGVARGRGGDAYEAEDFPATAEELVAQYAAVQEELNASVALLHEADVAEREGLSPVPEDGAGREERFVRLDESRRSARSAFRPHVDLDMTAADLDHSVHAVRLGQIEAEREQLGRENQDIEDRLRSQQAELDRQRGELAQQRILLEREAQKIRESADGAHSPGEISQEGHDGVTVTDGADQHELQAELRRLQAEVERSESALAAQRRESKAHLRENEARLRRLEDEREKALALADEAVTQRDRIVGGLERRNGQYRARLAENEQLRRQVTELEQRGAALEAAIHRFPDQEAIRSAQQDIARARQLRVLEREEL
jgi:hypothetical protein